MSSEQADTIIGHLETLVAWASILADAALLTAAASWAIYGVLFFHIFLIAVRRKQAL